MWCNAAATAETSYGSERILQEGEGGSVDNEEVACRQVVELVTDYLEGALPTDQRLIVERHLAFCAPCVDYLDQMRATIAATGALRDEDVPEPVMDSLLHAFREFSPGSE
jgi:hypothetical protein